MDYKWIGVEDRLPEIRIPVLIFDETMPEEEDGFPLDIKVDVLQKHEDGYYFWCKSDFEDITHWMPLPEPPGDDNGK